MYILKYLTMHLSGLKWFYSYQNDNNWEDKWARILIHPFDKPIVHDLIMLLLLLKDMMYEGQGQGEQNNAFNNTINFHTLIKVTWRIERTKSRR